MMTILLPLLALLLVGVPAAANHCDPAWLAAATREEVGELIHLGGADVEAEWEGPA